MAPARAGQKVADRVRVRQDSRMPIRDMHVEPFLQLADVTDHSVLLAWGAFWFYRSDGQWQIVDDGRLPDVAEGRRRCIGASAEPYGDAVVEVLDARGRVVADAGTRDRSWTWVDGLDPDTEYRYRVRVGGADWASGERWDWVPDPRGGYDLMPAGREYDARSGRIPPPTSTQR